MNIIRSDIMEVGEKIVALQEDAYYAYRFLVDELCQNTNATENEVSLMLTTLRIIKNNNDLCEVDCCG